MWEMVALGTGGQGQVLLEWEESGLRGAGSLRTEVCQEVKVDVRPLFISSHTHIVAGTAANDHNGGCFRWWWWWWSWGRHWRRGLFFLWLWCRCWQCLDRLEGETDRMRRTVMVWTTVLKMLCVKVLIPAYGGVAA